MIGTVISSSSPAVAARCAWARARIGAVCTQNLTDPTLGTELLERLAKGDSAATALATVTARAQHIDHRQLIVIDAAGRTAAYSGAHMLGRYADAAVQDCAAAGNLLGDKGVAIAMTAGFTRNPEAPLGDRLVAALRAGRDSGGEEGPVHSAGLLVVDSVPWAVTDLRVDWTDGDPVDELAKLWERWKPVANDYVMRALHPSDAPSFGVPGDR